MDKSPVCKVCGYQIVMGGRYPDQVAQEHGFCGSGCQEVHDAVKQSEMTRATL